MSSKMIESVVRRFWMYPIPLQLGHKVQLVEMVGGATRIRPSRALSKTSAGRSSRSEEAM
jgi:hypothetical protein